VSCSNFSCIFRPADVFFREYRDTKGQIFMQNVVVVRKQSAFETSCLCNQ
jgi:hypothetical protein